MIKDKIEYIAQTKTLIKQAIVDKGVPITDTDTFRSYATKISQIPGQSPTETLPDQTILIANVKYNPNSVELVWSDVHAAGYKILRKENITPASSSDGTVVYNGTALTYSDTDITIGKTYYYRIFPYNANGQFQGAEGQSIAEVKNIDRTGQKSIAELSVGDVIKFGRYEGSEFIWKIVDTQEKRKGYVTMAANQNLGNIYFDAPENATNNPNPVTNRKNQGNNRWLYSNIRQLLNSEMAKGSWYTAQHEYDVQPNYATSKNGFLYEFTEYEKSVIVKKTNKCVLDTNDGGGSETMIDTIWFPSSYAMGLEIFQPLEDEYVYEAFTDNNSRSYTSNYWLRTINGISSASGVRYVSSNGSLSGYVASGNNAARPFCLLPTSAYVAWSDSDNAYVFADDSQRIS